MKKRIVSLILILLLITFSITVYPVEKVIATSGTCGENATWTFEDGTLTISGTGSMDNFEYDKGPWIDLRDKITSVVIDYGITDIGEYAFYYCKQLVDVNISNSVTTIKNYSFKHCTSLKSIIIPDSVKEVAWYVFEDCINLESIYLPEGITYLGNGAFSRCVKLKELEIPDTVTTINYKTFANCDSLRTLTIPDGVKYIPWGAFESCDNLVSINIPNGVTTIDYDAFYYCISLTEIVIPDSVTTIKTRAFAFCKNLTDVTLPKKLSTIDYEAFTNCTNLEKIKIPGNVRSIGIGAFNGCKKLKEIIIPNSVLSVGALAFSNCANLESIVIPGSVNNLGSYAFSNCKNLKNVIISPSVVAINEETFENCTNLTDVYISNTLKIIKKDAFNNCENIRNIYYAGSESEWNEIEIAVNNDCLNNAEFHFNIPVPEEKDEYFLQEVVSDTPSKWAKNKVDTAINLNMLPEVMRNNYQTDLNRAEFCRLLTSYIEVLSEKEIEELIAEKGGIVDSPFKDANYKYIDYMYALGIAKGYPDDVFLPLGLITREEAATMLERAVRTLGYKTSYSYGNPKYNPKEPYEVSQYIYVSDWAKDGVGYLASKDYLYSYNNSLAPRENMPKEHAIITLVQLYYGIKY